ncbi:2-succinyl-5-enolpyruvyl-6-hydroxy-3-cyclohexene-1-carboxylic-acid synthase [Chryseomicrobium sp. FSL W7-1435]|uniref:2-succinyl-5-enolpyruvyl-6-hydroxy-3- cyclohexene-1-carboxylic-acid synthase n=1 Tax=Chryseomicrobium sp. FSL W7-1435 TaxID=2921704 RepID=UPI003159ED8C
MSYKQRLTDYVRSLLSGLKDHGVTDVVVSPGSRSTPLAYGVITDPDFSVSIQVDERSAGFYALGLAKASEKPVALLCTSGSAAANYFPAIVEAYYARVPLIVMTADRPHELRDVGAPQTIDQVKLYGNHVKWSFDYPVVDTFEGTTPFVYQQTARALSQALQSPQGPVHLNVPFREPLLIDLEQVPVPRNSKMIRTSQSVLDTQTATELIASFEQSQSGIVIVGETAPSKVQKLTEFLVNLGWPVLCDPLSNLRSTKDQRLQQLMVENYDALLKDETKYKLLAPDVVVRIGPQPVSKFLGLFLKSVTPNNYITFDESARFRDPLGLTTDLIVSSLDGLSELTPEATDSHKTLKLWRDNNKQVRKLIEDYQREESDEGAYVSTMLLALPEETLLFASSSMPIRDLDTFQQRDGKGIVVLANRGTNGIDGVLSTALGAQKAMARPMYLLIGDLALLHDSNGLLLSRYQDVQGTIVVMNNDGGGIFSYLPQAAVGNHFETLFGTSSGLTFEKLAEMYEIDYTQVSSKEQMAELIPQATKGLRILEVKTNRPENTAAHRRLWQRVKESWIENE